MSADNNKKSLEEIISFNELFDDHINAGSQEDFIVWLKKESAPELVNSYIKKYFYLFKDNMTASKGVWLLESVYSVLNFDNKVEIFNSAVSNEVVDVFSFFENKPDFQALMLSIESSAQFKVIWVAQNTYKDLSFLWENKSYPELLRIAENLYLSDYKEFKPNACFQNYLISLLSNFKKDVRGKIVKKNILSIMRLTDSTNKLPEIFLDALMNVYFCIFKGKFLLDWDELLIYVNIGRPNQYKNLEDWLKEYQEYLLSPCQVYVYNRIKQFLYHTHIKASIDRAVKKNKPSESEDVEASDTFKL